MSFAPFFNLNFLFQKIAKNFANFVEIFPDVAELFLDLPNFWPNFAGILLNFDQISSKFFRIFAEISETEKVTADVCRAMRQGSAFRNFTPALHASRVSSFS